MKEQQRILCTLRPYYDESLYGYLIRLTEVNNYPKLKWILEMIDIGYLTKTKLFSTVDSVNYSLSKLSDITGINEEELWKLTFVKEFENLDENQIVYSRIRTKRLFSRKIKVCPCCLQENQYFRKVWELVSVTTCPKHEVFLIDRCPECKDFLKRNRSSVSKCHCGYDLCDSSVVKVSKKNLRLTKLIHTLLGQQYHDLSVYTVLYSLNIWQLHKILLLIMFEIDGLPIHRQKVEIDQFSLEDNHKNFMFAFEVFNDWPKNFHEFLDNISPKQNWTKLRQVGVIKEYGAFFHNIYDNFLEQEYDFLRKSFEHYLKNNWTRGHINRLPMFKNDIEKKYLSMNEVCTNYGISDKNIKVLVEEKLVEGTITNRGKTTIVLVDAQSMENYKLRLENTLTLEKTVHYLGISEKTVRELIKESLFTAFRGPGIDGYKKWHIEKNSIEELFNKINMKVKEERIGSEIKTVNFYTIVRNPHYPCKFISFLKMILNGEIVPCKLNEQAGFAKYDFDERDVLRVLNSEIKRKKEMKKLSISDVSNLLGVKREIISYWINKGLLTIEKPKKGKRASIDIEIVNDFRGKYITLKELIEGLNWNLIKMNNYLKAKGILPVSGPTIDGGKQYLYYRNEVELILSKSNTE
ncbi:MerR family transcriptional regulator [Brevibacillus laterosporus]|nr:TniQ family protein [Brevibacillus laterosporus]TPG70261.1 MerR family transcriptional regulator [Brevibacillus laterosporus]